MQVLKTLKLAYITYNKDRGVYQLYQNDGYEPIADIHVTGSWFPVNIYIPVKAHDDTFNCIKVGKCSVANDVNGKIMIVGIIQLLKGVLYE